MTLRKIIVIWILVSTVTLIAGYLMTWHGAVYSESAERTGGPGLFYNLEFIAGQILMWPAFGFGWLMELINPITTGHRKVNVIQVLGLHYSGYGIMFLPFFMHRKKMHFKETSE